MSGVLELDQSSEGSARYVALDKWNNQLNNLQKLVVNKMAWKTVSRCDLNWALSLFWDIVAPLDRLWYIGKSHGGQSILDCVGCWFERTPALLWSEPSSVRIVRWAVGLFQICWQNRHGRHGGGIHRRKGFRINLSTVVASSSFQVIDKRVGRNGKTEYLLKWRGFGDEVIAWRNFQHTRASAQ